MYLENELAAENLDFLEAVDTFKATLSLVLSQRIYDQFVRSNAPSMANLKDRVRNELASRFEADVLDAAFQEVNGYQEKDQQEADFLKDKNQLKRREGALSAWDIYHLYLSARAPANLAAELRVRRLSDSALTVPRQIFETQPTPDQATFFDAACREIYGLMQDDSYRRFEADVSKVRAAWTAAAKASETQYVSRPSQAKFTEAKKPDSATVKSWNEKALTALVVGHSTDFHQSGDVLIVVNPGPDAGMPPGLNWAQQQESVMLGKITMLEKGGAFSRGSIMATGVDPHNEAQFRAAIATFSKKEVHFP
jgi:hypothetical protein